MRSCAGIELKGKCTPYFYCYSNLGVYFNMAHKLPQFQRPLLRTGSIVLLAGVIIAVVSTIIHPSREDPANHPLVFAEYASDDSWIAVHDGQFVGVITVFAGGFVALYRLLLQSESNMASVLGVDWSCTCYNDSQCHCCSSGRRWNCSQDGSRFLGCCPP